MDKDDKNKEEKDKKQNTGKIVNDITGDSYKYGFTTDVDTEIIPVGLNEDVVRLISKKKNEPEWLL